MEVYLDNSATTRCFDNVAELVHKVMTQDYGNPSSMHNKGVESEKYLRHAREVIAKNLKVNEKGWHLLGDITYDDIPVQLKIDEDFTDKKYKSKCNY